MVSIEKQSIQSTLEQNKNSKQAALRDSVRNSSFGKLISSIEELDIGLTNPYFSKYTLNNIPVKGPFGEKGWGEK